MSIERKNIGIFGRTNVGKSTLMNLFMEGDVSIVDEKPGTTADVKTAFMEIHGFGPIKIFDTAGLNEEGRLGKKKKEKSFFTIKECDLVLLIIDPFAKNDLLFEKEIVDFALSHEKELFIFFNIFKEKEESLALTEKTTKRISSYLHIEKFLFCDFTKKVSRKIMINFILQNFKMQKNKVDFFPFLKENDLVFLNIPLDEESPEGRLLKPQALVLEKLLRRYVSVFSYRMDLKKARSTNPLEQLSEYKRFLSALNNLKKSGVLKLVITDSSAIDIVHKWTEKNKKEIVSITTFSIIMAHLTSGGRLKEYALGLKALNSLKKGDKILIAEACNHNRIAEDIGTVQIPNLIKKMYGEKIVIDHLFGKDFVKEDLKSYKLIIHCGGCMLDRQKALARLNDLKKAKVAFTNYGLFLSYMASKDALKRVLKHFV